MKKLMQISLLLALLASLALPGTAYAKGLLEDKVVFGGTYTLENGETLDGNLLVFGGIATLEDGSNVEGDIVVMGGTVDAGGDVGGDIVAIGGLVNLAKTAVVDGDVATLGAHLAQESGAQIEGKVINGVEGPATLAIVRDIRLPMVRMMGFQGLLGVGWFFLKILLWMVLGVLVVLFLPKQTERTAQAAVSQPILSGGLGLLTAVILPPVLIILGITICFLPVSLVLAVSAALVWAFGLIALGLEIGKRIGALAKQEWAPAVSAGLGTFVLMLVLNTVGSLVPCVGWILPAVVGCIGFGAGILTRLGSQPYPPEIVSVEGQIQSAQAVQTVEPRPDVEQTPPATSSENSGEGQG